MGVDGSRAALNAVCWARLEAISRDTVLRLVHAVPAQAAGCDAALTHAERTATATPHPLRVEVASVIGSPDEVLLRESQNAAMVCIGSKSIRAMDGTSIGPTAKTLAAAARCPVAIIRTRPDGTPHTEGVVAVVLSDEDGNDEAVHLAMHEGRLRHATVRQIDQRATSWVRRYPDVHVETVAAGTGRQYDRHDMTDGGVGLAVVGRKDAAELADVTSPNCHPILGYPDCSVLVVRA
ncbi:universal stress protein [Mycolicibacterium iranicum]|uniref:universal stress protein n=1 Tax=Mycolicibacterium iranicum TaxID=912594 RepID=UPI0022866CA0|nr:universal stress protein [Mycolicibacterium iranicum]